MKKFNTTVKQNKNTLRNVFAAFVSILLVILLAAPAIISSKNKAWATPTVESVRAQISSQASVLDQASNEYGEALAKQEEAQALVDEAQGKIDEANERITDLGGKLKTRVRSMYRKGTSSFLDLLLGSTTFRELVNNIEIINAMNAKDASLVSESKALRAEVEAQMDVLNEQLSIAQEQAEIAYQTKSRAESIQADLQAQLDQLSAAEQEQARQPEGGGGGGGGGKPAPFDPGSGSAAVNRACAEIGKPYVWGGVGPDGYDCSGLVSYALTGAHRRLGTAATFCGYPRVSDPQPGDICCNSGHCGIYYGGGSMVHAPTFGQTVCIAGVQGGMIYTRYGG